MLGTIVHMYVCVFTIPKKVLMCPLWLVWPYLAHEPEMNRMWMLDPDPDLDPPMPFAFEGRTVHRLTWARTSPENGGDSGVSGW